ncbi:MAG: 16S rRNA (adenine(1518)-N(6)/adenine(1519)-N(6))-dimethyltransferase RsmA [Candidatus Micrarchaeota archaeon]|nr:16S rRNA (adenine(1518)-N(6)/adenine(1519)-N(6))-dimethyltransferase RsmA [Candidatus Micrarchaeota archaeon]
MKAKLGQHFIIDESVLELEAALADVKGKQVLEIGAGDGRLTEKLLSFGAKEITAVELDEKFASILKKKFKERVAVVQADFLDLEPKPFERIVGNIPYYITSPIIVKLSDYSFEKALLCVQKEVALRIVAPPGCRQYGRLSVFCQLVFKPKLVCEISKQAFFPRPKVDSSLVALEKTGLVLSKEQQNAIAALFSHKKKTLKNAIIDSRKMFGIEEKHKIAEFAKKLKYAQRKVFTLSPKEVVEILGELEGLNEL